MLLVATLSLLFVAIHAIQVPFYLPHHDVQERQHTFKLKTIYHHASAHGPIPNLFRRLDINARNQVNQQQDALYQVKSKLSVMDRPVASQHILNQRGKLTRMQTLDTLESTIGVIPKVNDRESMISLAMMTNNAYLDTATNNTEWYDLGADWHLVKVNVV